MLWISATCTQQNHTHVTRPRCREGGRVASASATHARTKNTHIVCISGTVYVYTRFDTTQKYTFDLGLNVLLGTLSLSLSLSHCVSEIDRSIRAPPVFYAYVFFPHCGVRVPMLHIYPAASANLLLLAARDALHTTNQYTDAHENWVTQTRRTARRAVKGYVG